MLNKVILMGRLTKDPELRVTQNETSVTSFTLAVERDYAGSNGERHADFINCVAFRNAAEFIKKYFVKGQLMCVYGMLQTRTWEAQDGKKNYATEVIVREAHFTGDRRNNENNSQPQEQQNPGEFVYVEDNQLPF